MQLLDTHSPMLAGESQTAGQSLKLAQELGSVITQAETTMRPRSQPQRCEQLPQFELVCSADCELSVNVDGQAPGDLYVTVTGQLPTL